MNETSLQRQTAFGRNWVNVILAAWIIISPFILGFSNRPAIMWSNVATGAAIFLLSLNRSGRSDWPTALVVTCGIWLIVSPFVLGAALPLVIRNNIVFGILVAIIALSTRARHPHPIDAPHSPNP